MQRGAFIVPAVAAGLLISGCAGGAATQDPLGQASTVPTAQPTPKPTDVVLAQRYLVILDGAPVATYAGAADGTGRTAPDAGQPFDPNSIAAQRRSAELTATQQALAAQYGFTIVTHYTHSLNGFAADLTDAQATALRSAAGVTSVEADRMVPMDSSTPSVLDGS